MKRKLISILLTLALVLSFSLVTAVPVAAIDEPDEVWVDLNFARDIDGVLSPGEWGTPLCAGGVGGGAPGTYQTVTVYAHATMDALYLAFDTGDMTDNRGVAGLDVLDWNIGLVGSDMTVPWRYALRTKISPDESWGVAWSAIDNGYYGCWEDTWNPNPAPLDKYWEIPAGLEMVTSFGTGHRVTEFKVPMSLMFEGTHGWNGPSGGETLLLGGTFSGEDAGLNYEMLWWPTGIDHGIEGTYATTEVEGRPSTPLGDRTFGLDAFVTIQGGINGVAGSTVNVAAGTYNENVVIPPGKDNLELIGAGSGVTSIAPASGRPVTSLGWSGFINGFTIKGFTLVTADGSHAFLAGSGTADGTTWTTDLVLEDIVMNGGQRGIGLNSVNGVTLTDVHLSNISGSHEAALELTGVSNLLFTQGSIEGNAIGVRLQISPGPWGDYGPNVNIQIHFTNFRGNDIAIENQDDSVDIDATNNYWGHPSGPKHNPGYGDPVSGNVLFNPWLLGPFAPGAPPPTYDKTLALNIGWTLVSTDNWINAAETVVFGVTLAYGYTPDGGWFPATLADLEPVDALYLKTTEGGALGIIYSESVPVASSKDLEAGWNLISSATIDNARAILSPLRYALVGSQEVIGLATLVSQGNFNQHTASLYLSTLTDADWDVLADHDLNPFDGYWVYMNAGKDFGVVPD